MGEVEKRPTYSQDGIQMTGEQGLREFMEVLGIPDAEPRRLALFFQSFEDCIDLETIKKNPEENATFSEDSIIAMRNNVMQYVMARLWHRWALTGKPPHYMKVRLDIEWER